MRLIRLGVKDLLLRKPLFKDDILRVTHRLIGVANEPPG